MRGPGLLVIGMVVLWSTLPASAALATHGGDWQVVERVSVASDGSQANRGGSSQSLSGDGRIVAFSSEANDLVPGDSNRVSDVFVHDRATGRTERVSVASDGSQANDFTGTGSGGAVVSGDGRIVAFRSAARNLVPGDSNYSSHVFVHDRATGRTERVSVASDGSQADGNSGLWGPAVSGDGRIVAFSSEATNLVPGDSNRDDDVFVHDRATGHTERVSVASDGSQANNSSDDPVVSGDGRIVAFSSRADNLVSGDSNDAFDVFVHDRATGHTERVSVATDGSEADRLSQGPAVSGDGRIVAFSSRADNLVAGDSNGDVYDSDVFVHDRATGRTERVSVARDGSQANNSSVSGNWAVTGDGRTVAFISLADNLVPGDTNGHFDTFVAKRKVSSRADCTITGSASDDVLIGTAGDDVLCGRGGDDRLSGRGGDDILRGGRGRDRLRGGWGADRLGGRRGPDRLYGGYGPDRLYGGYGDDVLRGGPGPDRLRGGPGDDLLFGGPGDDRLRGNRGVDLLPERHD